MIVTINHLQEFITSNNRPKATRVTRVIQGYEPHSFKSNFDSWPSSIAPSAENRGKVAENRGKVSGNMNGQFELFFISSESNM